MFLHYHHGNTLLIIMTLASSCSFLRSSTSVASTSQATVANTLFSPSQMPQCISTSLGHTKAHPALTTFLLRLLSHLLPVFYRSHFTARAPCFVTSSTQHCSLCVKLSHARIQNPSVITTFPTRHFVHDHVPTNSISRSDTPSLSLLRNQHFLKI